MDVEARENGEVYSLVANRASVPAGSVTIKLSNKGTMQHEMVVLETDDPIDGLAVDADQKVSENSSVGEVGEIDAGTSGVATPNEQPTPTSSTIAASYSERLSIAMAASARTWQPVTMSSSLVSSAKSWLMPPMLGMNNIAQGR